MLESQIQKSIINHLKGLPNCWAVKVMAASKNGTPDLLCCYEGRFVALEVKTPIGRTSAIQDYQINQINLAGGSAHVVRSVDDVKAILTLLKESV